MDTCSQLMDQVLTWNGAAAVLSGALAIVSGSLYVRDIWKGGGTKPSVVSYFLWTMLQAIALIGQFKQGASLSAVFVFFATLDTAVITVFAAIGYGSRKCGWTDLVCFILAMGAAVVLMSNPVDAIWIAIAGDAVAFGPTVVKTWKDPHSEDLTAWGFMTASASVGIASTAIWDVANLAFPIYQVVITAAVCSMIHLRRRHRRCQTVSH